MAEKKVHRLTLKLHDPPKYVAPKPPKVVVLPDGVHQVEDDGSIGPIDMMLTIAYRQNTCAPGMSGLSCPPRAEDNPTYGGVWSKVEEYDGPPLMERVIDRQEEDLLSRESIARIPAPRGWNRRDR